ncbi:hypothetical protein C8T65DRAFT_33549 [Cerioporus squamosus]|nr:hypothetical protein C8T65DRAFT_33549 [Cerioporus squamosus]
MGGTGWLFLFSVLMAAGLLFTMVFFVRPLHPRLLSLPFPLECDYTVARECLQTTAVLQMRALLPPLRLAAVVPARRPPATPTFLAPSPPLALSTHAKHGQRPTPSEKPPHRWSSAIRMRPLRYLRTCTALISNAHVSPAPATPLNISVTMLGVLSS